MFLSRFKALKQQSAVRLTLGLLFVFAFVTVLAGFGTYSLVQREMTRLADGRLVSQANLVEAALRDGTELPQPGIGQSIAVRTETGSRGTLPFAAPDRLDGTYMFERGSQDFRYLVRTTPSGDKILISENMERQDELLEALSWGTRASVFLVLLVGAIAGLLFAIRGQKRLDLISAGLANVADGQLDTRIVLPGRKDDLSVLSDRINFTTERLAYSMEQMRVQSSNIAHDLRTPLARLRAGIETSLIDLTERDVAVDADALGSALEQIDHIVGTFNALLRLSRIESGAGKGAFKTVELKALVEEVADTFTPVIEDAGQHLRLEITDPAQVKGDPEMLVQVVANLIQNALRYGADGQVITIRVHGSVLSVIDQGPGIPFAEREKVLQPLYQLETTRQNEGFGLGLSMVAAVCELHETALSLSDGDEGLGLAVTLRFPKITNL